MTEIKYYPLIDCDSDGTEKMAMFPSLDRDTIMAQSKLWLEEMVPSYFRLCARPGNSAGGVTIHCPRCGNPLKAISEPSKRTQKGILPGILQQA